jgi:hypothetical protein
MFGDLLGGLKLKVIAQRRGTKHADLQMHGRGRSWAAREHNLDGHKLTSQSDSCSVYVILLLGAVAEPRHLFSSRYKEKVNKKKNI